MTESAFVGIQPQVVAAYIVEADELSSMTRYGVNNLLVDQVQITEYDNEMVVLHGYYRVNPEHPMIKGHFMDDQLMMGTLMLESMMQPGYVYLVKKGLVRSSKIRPTHFSFDPEKEVYPGDLLVSEATFPKNVPYRDRKNPKWGNVRVFPRMVEGALYLGSDDLPTSLSEIVGKGEYRAVAILE